MYLINIARALVYSLSVCFFLGRIVEGVWKWNWVKNANAIKQMHIQYLFCQTVSDSFLCFAFFSPLFWFCVCSFFSLVIFVRVLFILIYSVKHTEPSKQMKKPMVYDKERERERERMKEKMILCTHIILVSVVACFFLCRPICTCMTQKRPKIKISGIYCASWKCYLFANGNANTQTHRDTFIHFRMYMCVALTLKFLSNSKVLITVYLLLLMML